MKKKLLFQVFLSLIPILLMLLIEGVVRLTWTPPWISTPVGAISPSVFAEFAAPKPVGTPFHGRHIHLNSHGFRNDKEFRFEPEEGTYRIVFLGGSVAFGAWSSSRERSVSGILERCLKHQKKRVEILSLAESGDEAADELFWLAKLGFRLVPDLVISLTGYNDLFYSAIMPELWDKGSGRSGYARPGAQSPLSEVGSGRALLRSFGQLFHASERWVYAHSKSYQLLKHSVGLESGRDSARLHMEQMRKGEVARQVSRVAARSAISVYRRMSHLLESEHVPAIFFFQPVQGCAPGSKTASYPRDAALCTAFREALPPGFMVDLSLSIGDELERRMAYVDPVHLDDTGFDILGREMCRQIAERVTVLKALE